MVSVPLSGPERERPQREGTDLFEATPEQIPPQNLEAEEAVFEQNQRIFHNIFPNPTGSLSTKFRELHFFSGGGLPPPRTPRKEARL